MRALVLGASGLVGSELVNLLLKDDNFKEVKIIVRSLMPLKHPKLEQIIADYSTIKKVSESLNTQTVFSCIGSTKNKTPNKDEYYKIDHDYPILLAKLCLANGAKSFHFISSLGADSNSTNFYLKMKGETENSLKELAYPSLHLYQPSLLRGKRKEFRLLENISGYISLIINPLLIGSLKKYRSISSETVASAMHKMALAGSNGTFIYTSDKIKEIA